MSKSSAIMKFGEMLTNAANFYTVGTGPSFAWASPNDIVILGKIPDDINGRVCLVSLPDDEKRRFVRLYRHGNTIKTYYIDLIERLRPHIRTDDEGHRGKNAVIL